MTTLKTGTDPISVRRIDLKALQRELKSVAPLWAGIGHSLRFVSTNAPFERRAEAAGPLGGQASEWLCALPFGIDESALLGQAAEGLRNGVLGWEPPSRPASGAVNATPSAPIARGFPIVTMCVLLEGARYPLTFPLSEFETLMSAAWSFMLGMPDEVWETVRCAPSRVISSGGIVNEVWIGDRWRPGAVFHNGALRHGAEADALRLKYAAGGLPPAMAWSLVLHALGWGASPETTVRADRRTWMTPQSTFDITPELGLLHENQLSLVVPASRLPSDPIRWFESRLSTDPMHATSEVLEYLSDIAAPASSATTSPQVSKPGPSATDLSQAASDEQESPSSRRGPSGSVLIDAAGISEATFRRIRRAAKIGEDWTAHMSRLHRYSPQDVDRLIEAAREEGFRAWKAIETAWACWSTQG